MKMNKYFEQAKLMLSVLPIVGQEKKFALKGGTALNFFHLNLPRLSVDIEGKLLSPDFKTIMQKCRRHFQDGNGNPGTLFCRSLWWEDMCSFGSSASSRFV
jgi:hypothetical protein